MRGTVVGESGGLRRAHALLPAPQTRTRVDVACAIGVQHLAFKACYFAMTVFAHHIAALRAERNAQALARVGELFGGNLQPICARPCQSLFFVAENVVDPTFDASACSRQAMASAVLSSPEHR